MENLAFHSLLRWKMIILSISHYITLHLSLEDWAHDSERVLEMIVTFYMPQQVDVIFPQKELPVFGRVGINQLNRLIG